MKYGTSAGVLKPLEELALPDPRFQYEGLQTQAGERSLNAEDIRERLESYSRLHDDVPERVRTQFEVARNLMLYAYFVFEFQTQAQLQAYAALEYALGEKFGFPAREVKRGDEIKKIPIMLKELLRRAVTEGLIVPERLPSFEYANRSRKWFANFYGGEYVPLTPEEWLSMSQNHITDLRNHIAHGKPYLYLNGAFRHIEICADIINVLFPKPDEKASPAN